MCNTIPFFKKNNQNSLSHLFMRLFIFLIAVVLLSGCTHKKIRLDSIDDSSQAGESSGAKLLVQVIENDEDRNEKGVYLVDPVSGEATQLTLPPYQLAGLYGQNLILFEKNLKKYYRYDFKSKEYILLNFPPLKEESDTYQTLYIDPAPISGGDRILLNVFTYNIKDEVSDFLGDRIARARKDYLYSFSQDSFEEAKNIERARQLLGDKLDSGVGFIFWGFVEERQLAFFQLSGEGLGCSDIVAVDVVHNRIVQQIKENGWQGGTVIGCLYVNPTFDFGFYIESKNDRAIGKLVSLNDITETLYILDLTNIMDRYNYDQNISDDIYSLEWLVGKGEVAIGFTDRIAILNFEDSKINTIYQDNTLGQSYIHWYRNTIRSNGINKIAFVDYYSAKYKQCTPGGKQSCPSAEDSDNRYRVIVQDVVGGSQKILLDDAYSKFIIGWIDL